MTHAGDYIGHYCERGWLFVSPGRNFVFNPGIVPPTGKFTEEALRAVGGMECHTEEAIEWGALGLNNHICIHWYQALRGATECGTSFHGDNLCQGLVYTGEPTQTLTFFSMGYWQNRYQDSELTLHLAEGSIKVQNRRINERVRKY